MFHWSYMGPLDVLCGGPSLSYPTTSPWNDVHKLWGVQQTTRIYEKGLSKEAFHLSGCFFWGLHVQTIGARIFLCLENWRSLVVIRRAMPTIWLQKPDTSKEPCIVLVVILVFVASQVLPPRSMSDSMYVSSLVL